MKCVICGNRDSEAIGLRYDDRYGYPGRFELYRCGSCGHRFLDAAFDDDQLTRLYSDYYPRSSQMSVDYSPARPSHGLSAWWRGSFRRAFRWVQPGCRVLDIGCGSCESLGYLRNLGCDVHGVEADENVRAIARRQGFDVHIGTFDPELYRPGSFDVVTMDQVIEHVTDPVRTLGGIERILRPGGQVILSTPNASGWGAKVFGSRWVHWHAPYHLQHFSRESMEQASRSAGLEMQRLAHITDSVWLRYQWVHLLTRPALGEVSSFWGGSQEKASRSRRRLATLIHLTGVDHLLTRLFDSLGQGDNQLFFLRKPL